MYRWLIALFGLGLLACLWFFQIPATRLPQSVVYEEVTATNTSATAGEVDAVNDPVPESGSQNLYEVVRVIDGDTIDVRIGGEVVRVRYIGVDTPETVHPNQSVECFGAEASAHTKALVEGKWVRLERDISDTDKYGRLLRYVYVGDEFVNLALVEDGYATTLTYPPDVKFNEEFRKAEALARETKQGLWGAGCEVETDATAVPSSSVIESESSSACRIKGNISLEGERIYHTSDCEYYDKTTITESKGERWFCSESEALAAGWRKALNCVE